MSDVKGTEAASGSSEPKIERKSINKDQLISTVKTLQFAWFVGHLFTLIGVFFFTLTYLRIGKRWYWFWYDVAVFGIVESFGILVYQLVKKQGSSLKVLLKDDNFHFFGLGVFFLILRPYVIFPILPFQLFSLFHVLSYSKAYLFPVLNIHESSGAYKFVANFINNNNAKSIHVAGLIEVFSLLYLFVRVLLFRKRSLTPFLIYLVFIKLRYEKSVVIRNQFKALELKIDGLVNNVNNPKVKDIWVNQIKGGFRTVGSYTLVNDFSKEKVN